MSQLHDKINSYALERGIEFNEEYTLTPTRTGTNPLINTFARNSTANTVWQPGVGPLGGAGSWQFQWSTTSATNSYFRAPASGANEILGFNDQDYSVGFWVKFNDLPTGTSASAANILQITSNSTGFNLAITGSSAPNPSRINLVNTGGSTTGDCPLLVTNNWYYLAVRRKNNQYFVYLDSSLIISFNNSGTTASTTWMIGDTSARAFTGSYNISNYYLAPADTIDATAISEIWTAGSTGAGTDITITETPATATDAHFPEPAISTTTGISFGTEPANANAEISYLAVSGTANIEHSFALATAMMTEPTLAFTFNDNTEIFTSITASALMVDPFSFGGQVNISTSAELMEASATIEQHTVIAGISISYPAELIGSASALAVEPLRFGPDDNVEFPTPMLVSATSGDHDVYITPNQFNYIKRNNPLLYIRDYSGTNATLLNEGSLNFGPVDKGPISSTSWAITQQPSGAPLAFVGNGTSPSLIQPYSTNQGRFRYTDSTFFAPTLSQVYANKAFTHEFWYKPSNTTTSGGALNSTISYNDRAFTYTFTHTPTSISFVTSLRSTLETTTFDLSASTSILTHQNWHHIVILAEPVGSTQLKIGYYIDGMLMGTSTKTFLHTQAQFQSYMLSGTQLSEFNMENGSTSVYAAYDELAMYPNTLSNSEISTHFNFINTLSPNRTIAADEMTAEAQTLDPSIFVVSNKVFPATPITASSLFVDPGLEVSRTIDATTLTASALFVNPSFYGTPDYRQDAVPMIASAEKGNNSFALDGTYYSYVQTQIAPFRYVSFDAENPYIDHGSDNDYSVIPTSVGGTITLPANGINNKSAKTAGTNYTTDGVILKESEWDDTWGTGQNTNHSSFWMQRAGNDESSSGIRILWNLNGYKDNQHAILYQVNNKLHMQFNNGSGTFVDQATVADVNLFDYERHHVVIVFDHTNNNNNNVKLYVDSVLVMTVSLGAYTGTTTNYATSQPANDEAYNKPRLGIGCLITPFASTALSSVPVNTKLYLDEIHWALTGLNQTQVTSLYNIMPQKDNVEWYADFFLGLNATFVNPTFGTGNTITGVALTASADIVQPSVSTVYNNIIGTDPITASAIMVEPAFFGDNVTNINYSATFMSASAFITVPVVTITVPGQPMLATLEFATSTNPYLDDYRLLILDQTLFQSFNAGSFGGSYAIGDID